MINAYSQKIEKNCVLRNPGEDFQRSMLANCIKECRD